MRGIGASRLQVRMQRITCCRATWFGLLSGLKLFTELQLNFMHFQLLQPLRAPRIYELPSLIIISPNSVGYLFTTHNCSIFFSFGIIFSGHRIKAELIRFESNIFIAEMQSLCWVLWCLDWFSALKAPFVEYNGRLRGVLIITEKSFSQIFQNSWILYWINLNIYLLRESNTHKTSLFFQLLEPIERGIEHTVLVNCNGSKGESSIRTLEPESLIVVRCRI